MTEWHFFDKVLRSWLTLVVGGTPEEFYQFMEDTGYNDMKGLREEGLRSGFCIYLNGTNNDRGNYCAILWLSKFETAVLVHELSHLVMFVFTDKGIPISQDNTEMFSYYQEFWFNEIMRGRRKKPQGIKPSEVNR